MPNIAFALRMLFKTPLVTSVAIVSLALGIGANAAIFSIFNQMLLRNLPAQAPEQLVNLAAPPPKPGSTSCNTAGDCDQVFSYPMFRDLERVQTVFTGIAAHRIFEVNLAFAKQTINADGVMVSGSYFPVLGIQPAIGRLLRPDDDAVPGESPVVVLSHAFWQQQFGADPAVLNETMIVNGQTMTIVGVAPRAFEGTTVGVKPHVYVPLAMREAVNPGWTGREDRRSYSLYLFARLKPGVPIEQARAALGTQYRAIVNDVEAALQKGMSEQTMAGFRAKPLLMEPGGHGQSAVRGEATAPLSLLLGVTGLVLLIACANIANLLLARAAARAGEMSVRLSLGARRWQLVAQLLTESCLLALFGGAASIIVARWTLDLMASLLPAEAAGTIQSEIDPTLLAFTAVLALGTGVIFGLFPALHSTRPDLVTSLKAQAGQPSGARAAARFRTSLATVQIALSMALLISAGLFTKSLFNVSRVNLGLKIDNLATFGVSPGLNGLTPQQAVALYERLEQAIGALPGVTGVTNAMVPLLAGSNSGNSVTVEGFDAGPDTDTSSRYNEVGLDYFRTLGIPLIAGREFTPADAAGAPKVVVVNEAFARKFNLGREAVGKRIGPRGEALDAEIVGLVADAKYSEVKDVIPPIFFRPARQNTTPRIGSLSFYVRTAGDPAAFLANIPKVVAQLDPNLPVEDLRTMPQQVSENVFLDRFVSVLSAGFAGLATLLAAVGLYGVLAYTVAQRTREIGLRMALGAPPSRVRAMVMRQVGVMTLVGGAAGVGAALGLARVAESLLFEMNGSDPAVLAGAAAALTIVALGAGAVPAHRASQVDPMRALRCE